MGMKKRGTISLSRGRGHPHEARSECGEGTNTRNAQLAETTTVDPAQLPSLLHNPPRGNPQNPTPSPSQQPDYTGYEKRRTPEKTVAADRRVQGRTSENGLGGKQGNEDDRHNSVEKADAGGQPV